MPTRLRGLGRTLRAAVGAPLFREFLRFGSSSIAVQVSRVASGLMVAALLGPATWGTWYLLNLIIAYGALTQLGALNGMNREVPSALGRDDPDEALALRRTALGLVLVSTSAVSLLLLLAAWLVPGVVGLSELVLMLVLLGAHQLFGYATTSLKATTHFTVVARLHVAMALTYPLLTISAAWAFGLVGFIVAQVMTYALLCALAARSPHVIYRPRFSWPRSRALIAIGFPIMLVGLVNTFFSTVDRWVVAAFLGTEPLGHYSLAIMTLGAVGLLPQVIAQQFYPRVAFAWSARGDPDELRRMAAMHRKLTFLAVIPVVIVLVLVLPSAVRAFLPAYTPGIPALMVTVFVPLVSAVGQGYGGILHMLNRQTWLLAAIIAAALVNGALSALLVGPFGLVGVAYGTLLAFALYSGSRVVLGAIALWRVSSRHPGDVGGAHDGRRA